MSLEQVLAKLDAINSRLASLENKVGGGGGGAPAAAAAGGGGGADAPAVSAYQALADEHLSQFSSLCEKVGGDAAGLGALVQACVDAQKALIAEASRSKKPSAGDLQNVLKPLSESIAAVQSYQQKSRSAKEKNHVFGVGEGIGIFGWVAVEPTPAPYAAEMVGAAKFYTDKILREFKGKDETQVAWVHAWTGFIEGLVPYIKQYHTTGLTWNARGGDAKVPAGGEAKAPAAAPAPKAAPAVAAAPVKGPGLFAELNKGGAVTAGLKKVARADTNKDKKISGKVESKEVVKASGGPSKPAKCELNGTKWTVEWQHNPKEPIVIKASAKNQTVYVYKCENAVIIIEGKINAISVDGCKKCGVVFDDVLATCEVLNCSGLKLQVKQKVPAIAIDKTAGIQVFLPATSLDTEIVSATSSEMNVVIPNPSGKETDDPIELPIPEQFRTLVKGAKLETQQVDHSGG
jgi:adenylyl cyclase-associated protein